MTQRRRRSEKYTAWQTITSSTFPLTLVTVIITLKTCLFSTCSSRIPVHPKGYPKKKKLIFARKIQTCQLAGESVRMYCFGSLHYSARRDVVVTRLYVGLDLSPGSQTSLVCHSRCLLPWCFDRLYSSLVVFLYLYFTTVHV